jgi:hypothetical protein
LVSQQCLLLERTDHPNPTFLRRRCWRPGQNLKQSVNMGSELQAMFEEGQFVVVHAENAQMAEWQMPGQGQVIGPTTSRVPPFFVEKIDCMLKSPICAICCRSSVGNEVCERSKTRRTHHTSFKCSPLSTQPHTTQHFFGTFSDGCKNICAFRSHP